MATWADRDGGKFAVGGTNWLKWLLRGDQQASEFFKGGAQRAGWSVESKGLESIRVTPI